MKRALVFGVLLLGAGIAAAMTQAEIRCGVLGMGGGVSNSPSYELQSYVGPTVVGVSNSTSLRLTHGPVPCNISGPTAVEDPPAEVPQVLRLHPNVPNPFNPSTTITFALPRDASRVRLRVYDLAGHQVRTLWDGPETAGMKSVSWNGRDDANRPVASGVYLYELVTPEKRLTRKMTLLK